MIVLLHLNLNTIMARYSFAVTEDGLIINAQDIVGQDTRTTYLCAGCGNELIAKVNGKVMKPHFAHKSIQECNEETYLHKLGKQAFFETYINCLKNNLPFTIDVTFSKKCRKYKDIFFKDCDLGYITKSFDLTNYYQDIVIEKKDGKFIPDLLLKSTKNPDEKIYVEIAVTHFLSEEKESSDNRIIEIPVNFEEDIMKIQSATISRGNATLIGFDQKSYAIPDSECHCMHKNFLVFYVYKNGKSFLTSDSMSSLSDALKTRNIIYFNILQGDKKNDLYYSQGDLYSEEVYLAYKKGIKIRNCFLCKYQGDNWSEWDHLPIFCKTYKIKCNSNQAAQCDRYRIN